MSNIKSPFLIYPNFISPLKCEAILSDMVKYDEKDNLQYIKSNSIDVYELMRDLVLPIIPDISKYYDVEFVNAEGPIFASLRQGNELPPACDNSKYLNGKWVQLHPRDISGYISLCDFNSKVPFDSRFEVYGGKYEFPQHGFGFNPQRGTLILHPSEPHFINKLTTVQVGDLYFIKFYIKAKTPMIYQPANFPGDYTVWFKDIE